MQDPALKAEKQDEFQKVQQAYELLSDDCERQKYDDQVKLAELRKQFQTQSNISAPRSSPKEFNVYTAEPPPSMARAPPPVSKVYTVPRSWYEDIGRGPRIFDAVPPRSSRRDPGYPSKRELEREAKERDRRRKAADKDVKDPPRAEKNKRDKQRDKDLRRDVDEKRQYTKPYIEPMDDEPLSFRSDRKKSSSGTKNVDKRDRPSGRDDDISPTAPPPPGPQRASSSATFDYATSYINDRRANVGGHPGFQRANIYRFRNVQPPAPTPPPMPGASSPFATPDEDLRGQSAKPRRGSGETAWMPRDWPYRELVEEPLVMKASPRSRQTAQFVKSTSTTSGSPRQRDVPRTNSLPLDSAYPARPVPGIPRSQTISAFSAYAEGVMRGRTRSRMHPQIDEISDGDDVYEGLGRERDGKHRSSRRHRSPEPDNIARYQVDGGRAKLHYSRRIESEADPSRYYSTSSAIHVENRPPAAERAGSYASLGLRFTRVKTSKLYGHNDVQYSSYHEKPYHEGYPAYA